MESKLDCCVVRDLLPSYLEELTEGETARQVRAHLETCPACRALAERMGRELPVEKAPRRALGFLRRVKRARRLAAALSVLLALLAMAALYCGEFRYPNTEAGRLAAVCDYLPAREGSSISNGITADTPLEVVAWAQWEDRLILAYRADNDQHVQGYVYLARGVNGRYQARSASYEPSQLTGGVSLLFCSPSDKGDGPDWDLVLLVGEDCRDIYTAELTLTLDDRQAGCQLTRTLTVPLDGENFLRVMTRAELLTELGVEDPSGIDGFSCDAVRLLDWDGQDITERFRDTSVERTWVGSRDKAEIGLLYVFLALIALLGGILARFFLRPEGPVPQGEETPRRR